MGIAADPGFLSHLHGWDLDSLEQEEGAVFGLTRDLRLALLTGGWTQFAEANGGTSLLERFSLGTSILEATPPALVPFYEAAYAAALESREPRSHDYDCSSPEELRVFRMTLYRIGGGAGLLVVNTPVLTVPADPGAFAGKGFLVQCCHCLRFRTADKAEPMHWAWIEPWVQDPPTSVSHTVCRACAEHHYPPVP